MTRTLAQPATRTARSPVLEKHVQEGVAAFLSIDGWRRIRTDLRRLRGMGVQEKGMADDLFLRYDPIFVRVHGQAYSEFKPFAEVLWCEFKRPGEKPRPEQIVWHEAERAKGALVLIVDCIDQFRKDYFAMGLARKVRS